MISFTLMMEAIRSSEISVLARAMRRNISEDGIFHGHRRENLKSYNNVIFALFRINLTTQCVAVCDPCYPTIQFKIATAPAMNTISLVVKLKEISAQGERQMSPGALSTNQTNVFTTVSIQTS
jgi:hypothetical protein